MVYMSTKVKNKRETLPPPLKSAASAWVYSVNEKVSLHVLSWPQPRARQRQW